jgi:tRNA A37 threonylcarbamoyladenosine dehydratase
MHTLRSLPNPSASDTPAYPRDERAFYAELVTRNRHFVPAEAQAKMRDLKVLVAGCGSGGGACIEPLARLGVTKFMIADNGAYELANLNRQHAFVDSIGVNKAEFHANELRRINPFIQVEAFTEGVTRENLDRMIGWADIIFDCVDVTTYDAIVLKLLLHEKAHAAKRPVFSMLDLGYC